MSAILAALTCLQNINCHIITCTMYVNSALLTLELVSPPPPDRLCDSVTEVFQLLVLKLGTVYHVWSGLDV